MRLAADLRVTDMIEFQDRYMSDAELGMLISQADIALLPYDSTDQVTSGVLVEAVGAGLPVIATRFPHAVELLSDGAGLTVPHGDSRAIAQAIEIYLTRPRALLIAQMAANRRAAELRWPSVARSHEALARLVTRPARSGAA
jgi:glycosyltransferase involved in cell wall biosynthesis